MKVLPAETWDQVVARVTAAASSIAWSWAVVRRGPEPEVLAMSVRTDATVPDQLHDYGRLVLGQEMISPEEASDRLHKYVVVAPGGFFSDAPPTWTSHAQANQAFALRSSQEWGPCPTYDWPVYQNEWPINVGEGLAFAAQLHDPLHVRTLPAFSRADAAIYRWLFGAQLQRQGMQDVRAQVTIRLADHRARFTSVQFHGGDPEFDGLGATVDVGPLAKETFELCRSLVRRGLRGVQLVISDAHEGLRKALTQCFAGATWQRSRVHFLRNVTAAVPKQHAPAALAVAKTIFSQPSVDSAREAVSRALELFEPRFPKVAELLRSAENDVLAYMSFPVDHWRSISSTNAIERLNAEIDRRAKVVGIFPTTDSLLRLATAVVQDQHECHEEGPNPGLDCGLIESRMPQEDPEPDAIRRIGPQPQ